MTDEAAAGPSNPSLRGEPGDAAMQAALDRLVPAVEALPAAGAMGLLPEIRGMAREHAAFGPPLARFEAALSRLRGFAGLQDADRDEAIRRIEAEMPMDFAVVLQLVYIAYYRRPDVQARIGWRAGPLQPLGFELPPFDDSSLARVRGREPFWRRT